VATFSPTRGVNEREPTLINEGELQDTDGAEYRIGEAGIFVAKGRDQVGDVGTVTGRGLYEAGFDGSSGFVIIHEGNSLHAARVVSGFGFSLIADLSEGSSAVVGSHYANRHNVGVYICDWSKRYPRVRSY
jgi:hypothetical protein